MEVEAGAYFKKGDILISTLGNPFIYNGIINREGDMGCIYGISAYGEITSEEVPIWTSVRSEDKSKYVRLATEEEKKSFAERIANTENFEKAKIIIKKYLSKYEYLLDEQKKYDFKPFDQVLVRASNLGNWNLHLFARVREEEYKNDTVKKANEIKDRVLKYVYNIKQERSYNNDLVGIFERYKDIADGDMEVAMNFIKEAYPFNEETESFIRKKFDMPMPNESKEQ